MPQTNAASANADSRHLIKVTGLFRRFRGSGAPLWRDRLVRRRRGADHPPHHGIATARGLFVAIGIVGLFVSHRRKIAWLPHGVSQQWADGRPTKSAKPLLKPTPWLSVRWLMPGTICTRSLGSYLWSSPVPIEKSHSPSGIRPIATERSGLCLEPPLRLRGKTAGLLRSWLPMISSGS